VIDFIFDIIQSILLIIASIIIIIAAIGIFRLNDDMDKVIYVRMHMFGMMDIACVLAMIGLGEYLLAAIYFILAPFLVHAMANAYYYREDERKYETSDKLTGRIDDETYNKIAISKNTTVDAKFKQNIESTKVAGSNNTKSNESTNDVPIKEVNTDDIENSNLNQTEEEYD
jgi:energy-converting hydrogenase B subunit C